MARTSPGQPTPAAGGWAGVHADADVSGQLEWYADADADGFGDKHRAAEVACDAPAGHVADHTDCDDDDAARNPDGEHCTITLTAADATTKISGASAGSYTGHSIDAGADYNADGVPDYAVGAYGGGSNPGNAYVFFGPLGSSESTTSADIQLSDPSAQFVGYWVGTLGDIDADGNADLGVLSFSGMSILEGPLSAASTIAGAELVLTAESDGGPMSCAASGFDFDGDGRGDFALGDSNWNAPHYQGAVYVEYGGAVASGSAGDAPVVLHGEAIEDNAASFGALASAGDLDGDGIDDLVIGATYNDDAGDYAGAAYVVSGGTDGTVSLADATAIITGTASEQWVGEAVAGDGDANGDGYGDIVIGAERYGSSYQGNAWLMTGPLGGTATIADAVASFPGIASYDEHGYGLAPLRDLDGDGFGDLVLGSLAEYTCAAGEGMVIVRYGPVSGTFACESADVSITGAVNNGRFSKGLSSPGDLDGDALGDLFIGAYLDGNGAAYLYPGALL